MRSSGQLAAVVLVAALTAVAPGSAHAARLSGQVIGPPYAAKKGTAMLVLLNAKSSRRAKLRSPIGELRVTARKVRVRGGQRILTRLLRVNDRFRTRAKLRRAARRAPYWRIASRRLKVTRRASTLSAAELQELAAELRADLTKLRETVDALARYMEAEFRTLRADLGSLRADLDALRSEFTALSAQVDALGADLAALEAQVQSLIADMAALNAAVASLAADLAALTATVGALSDQLGDLENLGGTVEELLAGVAPGDLAGALTDVTALQSDLAALQADVDVVCGPTSPLDALC